MRLRSSLGESRFCYVLPRLTTSGVGARLPTALPQRKFVQCTIYVETRIRTNCFETHSCDFWPIMGLRGSVRRLFGELENPAQGGITFPNFCTRSQRDIAQANLEEGLK